LHGTVERLAVDVLESGAGDVGVEVLAVEERVDFDSGLSTVGESALRALAGRSEAAQCAGVAGDVYVSCQCLIYSI